MRRSVPQRCWAACAVKRSANLLMILPPAPDAPLHDAHTVPMPRGTLVARLGQALSRFTQALLPSSCLCCGGTGSMALQVLCEDCADDLLPRVTSRAARCDCCGLSLPGTDSTDSTNTLAPRTIRCGRCLSDPPAFDDSTILTDYAPPVDTLIHDLKFRARLPLARAFGHLLLRTASSGTVDLSRADLLLPVPLSSARLEQRGFNQAVEIARPLAQAWRLPLATEVCVRLRDTPAQTGLPLSQRRVNMRGAFAVRHRAAIDGRHVVVIDDVMTTGHTLNELAACLKRHGAACVSNLVVARTPLR